ncbi:uncharacterized protein T551_02344 [Pneumocystis jirovecii RU7]|uniref:Protein SYS1 n=1 Tax=Pneumocystis jirovecii (strain RU7) TaxID=1408657 RepID=A0A0W4ZL16_PNEJ7|nr:uncharacterized protein T551_02344 [Pneumocystis jirovecii RU7]KTW29070.1 hypothetical protein T551_02344 [Pneumocystis jirovecii RU7]
MVLRNIFDPILIMSQIVAVQSLFYLSETALVLFLFVISRKQVSLDYIFDFHKISLDNTESLVAGLIWDINSISGTDFQYSILILFFVIRRTKQVLDFTLTMHFIHFIIVFFYSGHFPSNTYWWVVQMISCVFMCLGGEWMCMQRELKPITFGSGWQSLSMVESGLHTELYELDKIEVQKHMEIVH